MSAFQFIPIVIFVVGHTALFLDYRSRKNRVEALPMRCRFCDEVWALKFDGYFNELPENDATREAMRSHRCGDTCKACGGHGFIPLNGAEE